MTGKVPRGTFKKIITAAEEKFGLLPGSVNDETVLSRVKRNNISGVAHQRVSPLDEMEPLIIEWCEQMAKIGMALTRDNVVELVTDLIQEPDTAKKRVAFKEKRSLEATVGEKVLVVTARYKAFMKRNKERLKRARCKVKYQKRRTWCTYENFASMYNAVYDAMVEAKLAIKTEDEIMYNINGDETTDKTEMVGCPTTHQLIHHRMDMLVENFMCCLVLKTPNLEFVVQRLICTLLFYQRTWCSCYVCSDFEVNKRNCRNSPFMEVRYRH
jgi:hypothetical protein